METSFCTISNGKLPVKSCDERDYVPFSFFLIPQWLKLSTFKSTLVIKGNFKMLGDATYVGLYNMPLHC